MPSYCGMKWQTLIVFTSLLHLGGADDTSYVGGRFLSSESPQNVGGDYSASNVPNTPASDMQNTRDAIRPTSEDGHSGDSTPAPMAPNALVARVYQHSNFRGASRDITGDVGWIGQEWNDIGSSLIVYPKWCVTLYEHAFYKGRSLRFCATDVENRVHFVGGSFNDITSSIRVFQP